VTGKAIIGCVPLPGPGLVARRGNLVVVTDGQAGQPDPLLRALEEVEERGGAALVLAAARGLLTDLGQLSGACAGVTASGEVAVLVHGKATVTVVVDDGPEEQLDARGSMLPVSRTFSGATVRVWLRSGGPVGSDPRLRLDGGIVGGGGLALTVGSVSGLPNVDRADASAPPSAAPPSPAPPSPAPPSPAPLFSSGSGAQPVGASGPASFWSADDPDYAEQAFSFDYAPTQPPAQDRYLKGQCPDSVRVGVPFSVLASVVLDNSGNAPLKSFPVNPQGQDVLLILHAPRLQVLGEQRLMVRVPFAGDSEPVMFELRATSPGPCPLEITAWIGGTYLGQLNLETTASVSAGQPGTHRDFIADINATATEGAVSLSVRYDPRQNLYRFEFRDEDNPDEVPGTLAYEPGPRVEQLVAELDRLAKGRSGYNASETRDYLREAGAGLWRELLPMQLREQFWERQQRISQLTILADKDTVPWELLYPIDPGHDAGFLVEQFPVTRMVFNRRPSRSLSLAPAWFVLPDGSPARAHDEVGALLRLLQGQPPAGLGPVIRELTPLLELIRAGDFGLLHFACHNGFDPGSGSAISLDRRQFTPTQLNTAAIGRLLARSTPTVFINSCRSAGAIPSYQQLDGWASKFIEAGAGAFVGTLWAVRDSTAREFAGQLYTRLRAGTPLGRAVMQARLGAATEPGDPTWLAYTVYGDPRATVR